MCNGRFRPTSEVEGDLADKYDWRKNDEASAAFEDSLRLSEAGRDDRADVGGHDDRKERSRQQEHEDVAHEAPNLQLLGPLNILWRVRLHARVLHLRFSAILRAAVVLLARGHRRLSCCYVTLRAGAVLASSTWITLRYVSRRDYVTLGYVT